MLNAVKGLEASRQGGLFINSCFAHCQSERQDTWFAKPSPSVGNKVKPTITTMFSYLFIYFNFLLLLLLCKCYLYQVKYTL